jgi:hypothetical protein
MNEIKKYRIYKLVLDAKVIYIGITTLSLKRRKQNLDSSKHPNVDMFKRATIELVEETDILSRERYWIDYYLTANEPILNIRLGNGLDYREHSRQFAENNPNYWKEWLEKHPDYNKDRYKNNVEHWKARSKEYRELHREDYIKSSKEYYEAHKEECKENMKVYNEANKERLKIYRKAYYANKLIEIKKYKAFLASLDAEQLKIWNKL